MFTFLSCYNSRGLLHASIVIGSPARRYTELTGLYTQGADKSLARPGRKEATATEDFEFHISYL